MTLDKGNFWLLSLPGLQFIILDWDCLLCKAMCRCCRLGQPGCYC